MRNVCSYLMPILNGPCGFLFFYFSRCALRRSEIPYQTVRMNTGTRELFTIRVLVDDTDRVLATEPENQFSDERRRCNPPIYLHSHTASAELPTRYAPAKAVGRTSPRTTVITLVYVGGEGMNVNMVYAGEARHRAFRSG